MAYLPSCRLQIGLHGFGGITDEAMLALRWLPSLRVVAPRDCPQVHGLQSLQKHLCAIDTLHVNLLMFVYLAQCETDRQAITSQLSWMGVIVVRLWCAFAHCVTQAGTLLTCADQRCGAGAPRRASRPAGGGRAGLLPRHASRRLSISNSDRHAHMRLTS